jgi:uncharacterized protein
VSGGLPAGGPDLAEVAGRFSHLLHAAGVPVSPERAGRFASAIAAAAPATTEQLYWTARVTLLSGRAQIEVFDRVFAQVFGGIVDPADHRGDASVPPPAHVRPGEQRPPTAGDRDGATSPVPSPNPVGDPGDERGSDDDARDTILAAMSTDERLRTKDFASLTPEELRRLRILLDRLKVAPPPRRSRRRVRHARGDRFDLRATVAASHRTAGDPVDRIRRRQRTRPRRLVLLCDISGSMEPYARAYLQLLHSAVGGARAEAFVFATRLTRLTRDLRVRQPEVALQRAGRSAPDWSGGTRIGEALKVFNDDHGRRGMARGAVVVIVSDGWERDDPAVLGEQMARLSRLAHRIVWVNPRRASPRYEPLVGGMAAALPHVDTFVSGHSLEALDEVVAAISRQDRR